MPANRNAFCVYSNRIRLLHALWKVRPHNEVYQRCENNFSCGRSARSLHHADCIHTSCLFNNPAIIYLILLNVLTNHLYEQRTILISSWSSDSDLLIFFLILISSFMFSNTFLITKTKRVRFYCMNNNRDRSVGTQQESHRKHYRERKRISVQRGKTTSRRHSV